MRFLIFLLFIVGMAVADPARLAGEGRHLEAAGQFTKRAEEQEGRSLHHAAIKSYLNAAACLKMTGDLSQATHQLTRAQNILILHPSRKLHLHLLASHGALAALGKKPHLAIPPLEKASLMARELGQTDLQAEIENDLGIALAASSRHAEALLHFTRADALALPSPFKSRIHQNQLIASFQNWQELENTLQQLEEFKGHAGNDLTARYQHATTLFQTYLARNLNELNQQPATPDSLFHTLTAGVAAVRFGLEDNGFETLKAALISARHLNDAKLERAGLLSLADLYLQHHRLDDAKKLLNAARLTQDNPDAIQTATLALLQARYQFLAAPQDPKTPATLKAAITAVEAIRSDLSRTQNISDLGATFREKAGQPYLLLADYHLQKKNPTSTDFSEAREAIESFKAWELEDFYRDDCVNLSLRARRDLEKQIESGTGVLYIIPLSQRTEILLGTTRGTLRWTAPIGSHDLSKLARILRYQLESDYGSSSYLKPATQLYQHLIKPGEAILASHGIKHLVFIPDGALGNIPLQTLYNRETRRFLLQDFSLSIAPSLAMASADTGKKSTKQALLAGCSRFNDKITPLPGIEKELQQLQQIYQSSEPLINQQFTTANLGKAIRESSANVIHIGTHGEFGGTSDATFLRATNREKISLNLLEQIIRPRKYRGTPIDLLCLSACRTAAGSDRAALGFAGTAVKAGCRSVVATLWQVDDQSSTEIITTFHRYYLNGDSKVGALRKAQLNFLEASRQTGPPHPHFWAPFVLIGEWN